MTHGRTGSLLVSIAALAMLMTGCGSLAATDDRSGSRADGSDPGASPEPDRLELLRTCPAQAPSWSAYLDTPLPEGLAGEQEQRRRYGLLDGESYVRNLHAEYDEAVAADPSVAEDRSATWVAPDIWGFLLTTDEEASIWKRQNDLEPAVDTARHYLKDLPVDQAGDLRLDQLHGAVIVQVTRDAEHVREQLQQAVGESATIVVETIRYSKAQLKEAMKAIGQLEGLEWVSLGAGGGDGRVEVDVVGDAEDARRRIEAVVDPCMVLVTSIGPVPSPVGPAGLRGVLVARPCDDKAEAVEQGSGSAVEGQVQELLICSDSEDQPRAVPAAAEGFDSLVGQLARQSMSPGGVACAAIAYLVPPVYAVTASGVWQLELPHDACGQAYKELRDLLST